MDGSQQDFLEQYDDLSAHVQNARHQNFSFALQRWLGAIEAFPQAQQLLSEIEGSLNYEDWFETADAPLGMVGSGEIHWPINSQELMAAQIGLCRSFAKDKDFLPNFCMNFMYSDNDFNVMTSDVADQIFRPLAVDFRRALVRRFGKPLSPLERFAVPASDRIVAIDHNSPNYTEMIAAIGRVEQAIRESNDYPDDVDKEQRISELSAGSRLLQSRSVRFAALGTVLGGVLLFLVARFENLAVGVAADAAWNFIQAYFHIK